MSTSPEDLPVPAELAALAERFVQEHPECFWFRHPEARIETRADVRWVIHQLRDYGDKLAWWNAQALQRCLLPPYSVTS
jgi:hypothetical protein